MPLGYGRAPFAATGAATYAGCMVNVVLGIDIGGANLKAATADKRAVSVPFALWKEPQNLAAKLAELVAKFPDATEFAVTMTGELCDCYETKRQGVTAIVDAIEFAAAGTPVRIWGTDSKWHSPAEAKKSHLLVAASNWHALATFAGRFAPGPAALLIDIGSTTTDIVFLHHGEALDGVGLTDQDRLEEGMLVYTGVRRTPICALSIPRLAAEFFATTLDVYLVLGMIPEDPTDSETADGRPATIPYAIARLSRMLGGDTEITHELMVRYLAERLARRQRDLIADSARNMIGSMVGRSQGRLPSPTLAIVSGAGEFLAREVISSKIGEPPIRDIRSLNDELGPKVSACAPAYALAVLATERPLEGGDAQRKARPNQ